MNRRYGYFTLACVGFLSLVACHDTSTAPTTTPGTTSTAGPLAVTITVAPAAPGFTGTTQFTAAGQAAQLVATETLSDNTQQNVTSQVTWLSSNPALITVSATGVVTAVSAGQSTITATFQGVSGTTTASLVSDLAGTLNLTGTWSGTGTDSLGSPQFMAVLTQSGGPIAFSVTGPVTFVASGVSGTGTLAATVTAFSSFVPFVINGSGMLGSQTCTLAISGNAQVSNGTFTAVYAGTNSCFGALSNGQLTLTAQ